MAKDIQPMHVDDRGVELLANPLLNKGTRSPWRSGTP